MKKFFTVAICLLLMTTLLVSLNNDAQARSKLLTGVADGFGGLVEVEVLLDQDGDIIFVRAYGDKETEGIGTEALREIPRRIIVANSTDVDMISGATYTSEAVIYAVNNALNPEKHPAPEAAKEAKKEKTAVEASDVYQGFGVTFNGRIGPGKDNTGRQVYSFNQVYANVLFNENGEILDIHIDELEVATPNYDGKGMPHLSGFPGQGGYNFDGDHDEVVEGKTPDNDAYFIAEVDGWKTKRERGTDYVMSPLGTWADQMDTFEEVFVGKTVQEIEEWVQKYTSDRNRRPLKPNSSNEEDQQKYNALTEDEKEMLADVTSGASMSLSDAHGFFIEAIKDAYQKRLPINEPKKIESLGFGLANNGRIGPGKDNTGRQVYSFNNVYVSTLFDNEGKVVSIHVDELEVATPNYDGKGMPHLSGFPGQGGYNFDGDHDQVVEGKTPDNDAYFIAEVDGWKTKRERGEDYVMSPLGTWADQMDTFEEVFVGKTVQEIEEWVQKYTSDRNRRPLKPNSSNEEDQQKYNALTEDEKEMLADVTSGASMSLSDAHGYFIEAIRDSYNNRIDLNLDIE